MPAVLARCRWKMCAMGAVGIAGTILPLLLAALPVPLHAQNIQKQEGVLIITAGGESIGRERYKIVPRGGMIEASGQMKLQSGLTSLQQSSLMTLSRAGEPQSYEWKMKEPISRTIKVNFDGSRAYVDYPLEEGGRDRKEFRFDTARVALLDNNFFHHYILLAQLYDFTKGGIQTIPVLIPQSVQPGTVTVQDAGTDEIQAGTGAGTVFARRLDVTTPDNLIHVWLGEGNRLLRLTVPAAGVTVAPE